MTKPFIVFRPGIFCLLALLLVTPVHAAPSDDISIALDQPTTIVGRTVTLFVQIVNLEPDTIQPSRFDCIADGTSLSASSPVALPPAIAPNGSYIAYQSYTAIAPGTTEIHCELTATDAETSEQITEVSPTEAAEVLTETRLAFDVSASATTLTVGDTVEISASYANHGDVPFTDVSISCAESGRSLVFVDSTSPQTTLQPGESGTVHSTWRAVTAGTGPIFCSLMATDSGEQVTIRGVPQNIKVQ